MTHDNACAGDGGVVFWHDGYGLLGGQWIEEPCEKCGGWHERTRPIPSAEEQPR